MSSKSLNDLPYELLDKVIVRLKEYDLLNLRLTNRALFHIVNSKLFWKLQYSDNHRYRKELTDKHGIHCRSLSLLKLDNLTFNHINIFKSIPHLTELQMEETDVNPDVIDLFTSLYPRMRKVKISLLDKGQFSPIHTPWEMLARFSNLNVLDINYIDYCVAEKVFYSLPLLKEFHAKLISPPAKDSMTTKSDYDDYYGVGLDFKLNFKNHHLTELHIESWAKDVEVDDKLFFIHPDCFPNLNKLTLISYQSKNQSWFQYAWPTLNSVNIDYVRNDEDAESLMMAINQVQSFRCIMWSSSGKHLNQFIFNLQNLDSLFIENSLSQEVITEVTKTEKIKNLQIGVVNFNAEMLQLLNDVFPKAQHVQLGHCRATQELADTISPLDLELSWKSLKVFQLSPTIAAIASKAPNLKHLFYDAQTRTFSPLKMSKILKVDNPGIKVCKSIEI